MQNRIRCLFFLVVCLEVACYHHKKEEVRMSGSSHDVLMVSYETLKEKRKRYSDVEIKPPVTNISERDKKVLGHLIEASKVMDQIFWKQACIDCKEIEREISKVKGDIGKILKEYFDINYGPWDRLDDNQPFFGQKSKPKGAGFYPEDMTREEFDAWIKMHPQEKEAFESPFTVIKRTKDGLVAVPYSVEYKDDLEKAIRHLRAAAEATGDEKLRKFLESRAKAFLTNDYFESDCDWLDLGMGERGEASNIDVTIGPYEVYEDSLMNLKASFEAFITVVDPHETRKLEKIESFLDELEASLPIPDMDKNYGRGNLSPIRVVNVVYTAGDAKKGVQTTAFNLPNDEKVREAKGSKKVLLKNIGEAKFQKSLIPIAKIVLDSSHLPLVTFDSYFTFILMHEVSHGLGPGYVSLPEGTKTTVNLALKDTYSIIEECKADVVGVYTLLYLISKGVFPVEMERQLEVSYLAGIFRSVRFGIQEAHGKANMIEYNYLKSLNVFTYDDKTGKFAVDHERFRDGIKALAQQLLMIESKGDYQWARKFIDEYGSMPDEVKQTIKKVQDVPVDIRPVYDIGAFELSSQ